MVGILIVTHGDLAEALISTGELILGELKMTRGISIWPKESKEEVKDRIQKEVTKVDNGDGVVILTDILGGTPTNQSLPLAETEKVEVVTGVNISMLLALSCYREGKSVKEICCLAKKAGRRSIVSASDILVRGKWNG
jgi:PTS system mannose-specific IIA component